MILTNPLTSSLKLYKRCLGNVHLMKKFGNNWITRLDCHWPQTLAWKMETGFSMGWGKKSQVYKDLGHDSTHWVKQIGFGFVSWSNPLTAYHLLLLVVCLCFTPFIFGSSQWQRESLQFPAGLIGLLLKALVPNSTWSKSKAFSFSILKNPWQVI